jgi:Zn-dependent protease
MPDPTRRPTLSGSFRIFSVAGISVYVHWSWLLIGYLELQFRTNSYDSQIWNVAEYLSLFLIVLIHEFGHALACRQVGGHADEIVLWPLGGIAFVQPPPRPGALLWSIAAGPLVNVVLVPITFGAYVFALSQGLDGGDRGVGQFLAAIAIMNLGLLIFNMLPIYPLDGGQIFQALLWFVIGRARSLLVACVVGMIASVAGLGLALYFLEWWLGLIAAFAAYQCWLGFQKARLLMQLENAPRHRDARCPSCDAHPLQGPFWQCDGCGARFDTFDFRAQCPGCGKQFPLTSCPECGRAHPFWAWVDAGDKLTHSDWHEPKSG